MGARRSRLTGLRALAEQSARGFAIHDMADYAMALAHRGLFALLPFGVFLVAVLSFLRLDALLLWPAEQGPQGSSPSRSRCGPRRRAPTVRLHAAARLPRDKYR